MSTYRLRQLGRMLRAGTARIVGRVSLGQRWPDEPHAYIIEDLREQIVEHVECCVRPSWVKYCPQD